MSNYVTIRKSEHAKAGYTPVTNFNFAEKMPTVPLVFEELPFVIQQMSIAFVKRDTRAGEQFSLVGLQSLKPDLNLYILPNGKWLGGYKPAFYRAQPFAMMPDEKGERLHLSIMKDFLRESPADTDPRFYDENGELSEKTQSAVKFLGETLRSNQLTTNLCNALHAAGVLVAWPVAFKESDEEGKEQNLVLEGLFHVDADKLKGLPADQLELLNKSGALQLAYAQLLSESRLNDLAQLKLAQEKMRAGSGKDLPVSADQDLDSLFGKKDDLFSF